jgi:hypothetical protein
MTSLAHVVGGVFVLLVVVTSYVLLRHPRRGLKNASSLEEADRLEASRESLASVQDMRMNFETSLQRAIAAGSTPLLDTTAVLAQFAKIEHDIHRAPIEDLESLEDRAERLERLRAYVLAPNEILLEGKYVLSVLSQWAVPPAVLDKLQSTLLEPLASQDVATARAALHTLYRDYDYWSWYVDRFSEFMERTAWVLLISEAIALIAAINRLVTGDVILGMVGAGVCGALVSVISKMPAMLADAENASYVRRIIMRVGTGVAAASIGTGLLASGILTITLPTGRLADFIEGCGRGPDLARACSTGARLLLLGIGMVLGFSERALTSLEDRVLPPPPPTGRSTPGAAAQ